MRYRIFALSAICSACCPIEEQNIDLLRVENLDYDRNELNRSEVPEHALSYNEIVDIAIAQNLDLQVKAQEIRIKEEQKTGATWKILPSLMLNAEQFGRNRNTGSTSQSLTNQPPAPPSISSEQHDTTYDITFTWNILDFGLAYNRAIQEANRFLMIKLDYTRLSQNLVLEVTRSYWKAQLALRGTKRSENLIKRINEYQAKIRYYNEKGTLSSLPSMKMNSQLSKFKVQLQDFHRDFVTAKSQLAQFMGLTNTDFEMLPDPFEKIDRQEFNWDELEEFALANRPELYGKDVEEKVFKAEVHNAALQMLPGLAPYGQTKFDSNKFLIFNHWLQAGLKVTYSIFNLPSTYYDMKTAEAQVELVRKNRIALSLGVITQVQLALILYDDAIDNYKIAHEYYESEKKLEQQAELILKVGEFHEGDLLSAETDAFLAEMTAFERYGNLMLTIEQINNSIGMPRHYKAREENE